MERVLYLTRNGLAEPLGRSQVLAYLRGLARDFAIDLVTFERPGDLADGAAMDALRRDCAAAGIDWHPQPFGGRPRFAGAARDLARMRAVADRLVRARGTALIHARSYLPAEVARRVGRARGVPFLFDMRALWPDELIAAGRLRAGGPVERVLRGIERACLRDAAGVVSLTEAAVGHLRAAHPDALRGRDVTVIPTCADLDRFAPAPLPGGPRVWGCAGTVLSGWFRLDLLDAAWSAAAARDPAARFEVVSRDDPAGVRAGLPGVPAERLAVGPATPAEMPARLAAQHVGCMAFTGGVAKLGSAPTRLAEVLGTGRPVLANAGVGDVEAVVEGDRVGVVLRGDVGAALDALEAAMADPALPARCRASAERRFSLRTGTDAYRALYRAAIDGARRA